MPADLGPLGEMLACRFLEEQGYEILETDYRQGHHQADILAREGGRCVVIEVKSRHHPGRPEASMTPAQGKRLLALAREWFGPGEDLPRLDLVTVRFMEDGPPRLDLFRDLRLIT